MLSQSELRAKCNAVIRALGGNILEVYDDVALTQHLGLK
jgi:hypothetical protein